MQPTLNEQEEIIVRDSPEYLEYLEHRHGWHIEQVKKLETQLAIWGRPLLLIYIVYTVVKASIIHALPLEIPAVKYTLLGIEAFMLVLQVLGLEGGMPGLVHLIDEMEARGKTKEADSMRFSLKLVQWMLGATGVDIVLQATPHISFALPGTLSWAFDTAPLAATFTNFLLIARIVAVGYYLTAMARLSHKGPKIISKEEAQKQKEAEEQQQIRIDNANIMAVFQQAIEDWSKRQPNFNDFFSESVSRLNEVVSRKLASIESAQQEKIAALSRYIESAQIGSTGSGLIDSGTLDLKIESMLSRSLADLNRSFESKLGDLSRQVNRVEAETARHISTMVRTSQISTTASTSSPAKEPEKQKARITNIAEAREEKQGTLSVEEVVARIEADPALLKLSGQQLAERVNTSKPTANRAKTRYVELHPESAQPSDSKQSEAVNL